MQHIEMLVSLNLFLHQALILDFDPDPVPDLTHRLLLRHHLIGQHGELCGRQRQQVLHVRRHCRLQGNNTHTWHRPRRY